MRKVFGIGMHKTGTSSLGQALEILGYNSCNGAQTLRKDLGELNMMQCLFESNYETIFEFAKSFSAFNDLPWSMLYKELDLHFPNSQYILTIRNEQEWLQSCIRYFKDSKSAFRLWVYGVGSPVGNEDVFLTRYRRHNEEVMTYFENRANLLILDLEAENKWDRLVDFLNKTKPAVPYPHLNKNDTKESNLY